MHDRKLLSKTKNLVDGRKFLVYTKKLIDSSDVYSCNLCGVMEIRGYNGLKFHNSSILHKELSKLDKIPFKSWMTDCIISNNDKLDTLKTLRNKIKTAYDEETESTNTKEHKKHKKSKKIPKSYRQKTKNVDSDNSAASPEKDLSRLVSTQNSDSISKGDKSNERTFLSMFRQLTSLVDYLDENLKQQVKELFLKSVELERDGIGSSNTLLTRQSLKILYRIKSALSAKFDLMPLQFLTITNSVYDDILYFTEKFEVSCSNEKKIKNMKETLLRIVERP